jgi:large subunit ribosomal protein LP0
MPISKQKKEEYFARVKEMLAKYSKVFIVAVDNVGSAQMNQTRLEMRGRAEILMGKNTMMRKILENFISENPDHHFEYLGERMRGNVGFVFTNDELGPIRDFILANRVPAPARPGSIAPVDVTINKGPTGCDPGQTSFFQVLQIPTKIVKGQIEITNDVSLIHAGDKVGASEAALLSKLNIRPFSYGLKINEVADNGNYFSPAVLDIDDAFLTAKFQMVLAKVAGLSFAIDYPTQASAMHSIANAFKTMVAITSGLQNYTFPEADKYK